MIKSKQELKDYLIADRLACGKQVDRGFKQKVAERLFPDYNYEYVKTLRKLEFAVNNGKKAYFLWRRLYKLRCKTGIEIQPNCIGAGLHVPHGKCVVSSQAKIGCNCKILSDVTIGGQGRYDKPGAATIGDRVFIGTGAKIIGAITIANDCVIGANAVVTKSFNEPGITIGGNPAVKISNNNSYHYLNK